MSLIPVEQPRYDEMQKVVELYIQNKGPYAIAKLLGIRKVDVDAHLEEWRKSAVGSEVMKDRVEELIASMDGHYSLLIQKAYEVIAEVDQVYEDDDELSKATKKWGTMSRAQMLSQKMSALKAIADFEAKRIDVLQKSGLLEAANLGDELAAMEEQKQLLLEILKDELCSHCQPRVMARLAGAMGGTVIVLDD